MTRNINITRLRANISRRIKRYSGWHLSPPSLQSPPGAHSPRGTNAKNRTHDRRLGVVWIDRNRCIEALLLKKSDSLGVTVTVEIKQLRKNRESHSEVCMCGVLTHQWPSTHITLFERTRHSTWLNTATTPVDKMRVNSCVFSRLIFLEGARSAKTKSLRSATISKFGGWRRKKKIAPSVVCWNRAPCGFSCSLLHLECHLISISNLNLLGLFSAERGKRDLEN